MSSVTGDPVLLGVISLFPHSKRLPNYNHFLCSVSLIFLHRPDFWALHLKHECFNYYSVHVLVLKMVDMTSACLESTTSLNEPTRKFSLQRCFIAWLHFLRQSRLRRKLEQEKLVSNEQIARFAASFKEQKQRPFSYPFTLLSSGNSTGELRPASVPAVGNRSRGNNTASSIDKNFQRK